MTYFTSPWALPSNFCLLPKYFNYCARAIKTRCLYFFNPLFENLFFSFQKKKKNYLKILSLCTVDILVFCNQEQVIMALIVHNFYSAGNFLSLKTLTPSKISFWYIPENMLLWVNSSSQIWIFTLWGTTLSMTFKY